MISLSQETSFRGDHLELRTSLNVRNCFKCPLTKLEPLARAALIASKA